MKSFASIIITTITMLHSPQSIAMTECELLTRIMNKLGASMSINRHIISTQKDEIRVNKASEDLSEQTKSYKTAKRQYKRANCKSIWD